MTGVPYALVAHETPADLLASAEPLFAHVDPSVEAVRSNVYGLAYADREDPAAPTRGRTRGACATARGA